MHTFTHTTVPCMSNTWYMYKAFHRVAHVHVSIPSCSMVMERGAVMTWREVTGELCRLRGSRKRNSLQLNCTSIRGRKCSCEDKDWREGGGN